MSNLTWQEIEDILLTVRSRTWTDAYNLGREHGYAQAIASLHKPAADLDSLDFGKAILCELDDTVVKAKDALGHGSEKRGGSEHYGKVWTEHLEKSFPNVKEPVFHATTGPRAIQIIRDGFKSGSYSDFGKGNVGSTSMTHNADWALEGHRGNYIFVMDEATLKEHGDVTDHKDPTAENEYERRFIGDKIPQSEIKGLIINRKIGKMEREEAAEWGIPITYRTADGWATLEPKKIETKAKDALGHGSNKKGETGSTATATKPSRRERIVEHLGKTRGGRAVLRMGKKGVKIFHAIEKRALVVAKKTQRVCVLAGKERGLDEAQQKRLGKMLYAADFLGGYATGAVAVAAAAPLGVVKGVMLLPSASVAYFAYTTVKNPRATWRAAKAAMAEMREGTKDSEEHKGFPDDDVSMELAKALKDAPDPDWFEACFYAALAHCNGDVRKAIRMAVAGKGKKPSLPEKTETKASDDLVPSPAATAFVSAIKDKSVKWMLVAGISVAAEELQYKESDGAADGLSEKRRKEQPDTFDPLVVPPIAVWTADDGQVYVVDGHKRVANARRLGVPNIRVQFIQADSFEEAKKIGERLNEKLGTKAFDESKHPRADDGRFGHTAGAHESQEETEEAKEAEFQHRGVRIMVDSVKDRMRYRGDVQVIKEKGPLFERGGQKWERQGYCVLADRKVVIHSLSVDTMTAAKRITAHECMHGIYEDVCDRYKKELSILSEPAKTKSGLKMRMDGDPYPQFANEVKTVTALKNFTNVSAKKLAADDGVSPYSEAYWKDYAEGKVTLHIALHETLAEIAAHEAETGELVGTPFYRDMYTAVRKAYDENYEPSAPKDGNTVKAFIEDDRFMDSESYFDADMKPCDKKDAKYCRWWKKDGTNGWDRLDNEKKDNG